MASIIAIPFNKKCKIDSAYILHLAKYASKCGSIYYIFQTHVRTTCTHCLPIKTYKRPPLHSTPTLQSTLSVHTPCAHTQQFETRANTSLAGNYQAHSCNLQSKKCSTLRVLLLFFRLYGSGYTVKWHAFLKVILKRMRCVK